MQRVKADPSWVWAIGIYMALQGNSSLLEKLERELVEIWNGEGI